MYKLPFSSVALVTPAGNVEEPLLNAGISFLHSCGIKVKKYIAGGYPNCDGKLRAELFTSAWLDDSCDVVLAARGGFGSVHILDFLDWDELRKYPQRIVIGYSDITAIHWAMLSKKVGRPIAGMMGAKLFDSIKDNAEDLLAYNNSILGKKTEISADNFKFLSFNSEVSSLPVVGNLAVGTSLCGTKYLPSAKDKIILLEDLNEPVYKLDRYLNQLKMSGFFDDCAGVIFGHFTDCECPIAQEKLFKTITENLSIPVIINFPFGHDKPFKSIDLTRPITISKDKIILG